MNFIFMDIIIPDCGQPFISYGFLAAGSSTLYAGTATVECDPGYQVLGSTTANCLTTGDWDTPPQCTPKGKIYLIYCPFDIIRKDVFCLVLSN